MIDIFGFLKKVPGGALLIPMLISAVINTLFPGLWSWLGGTSAATFQNGSLCIVGIIMFAMGANTNVRTLGSVLKRNGVLILAKLVVTFVFGLLFIKLFGMDGILGISAVAFVTCMGSANPGVYLGIVADYGDQIDTGNVPLMTLVDMPVGPLLVMAASGATLSPAAVITVLVPYVLGIVLGNLDPGLAKAFSNVPNILLIFMGFNFGSSINLVTALQAGVAGVVLGVVYTILNAPVLLIADRVFNKRPGYAGIAMCSVAGISVAIPTMLGEAFAPYSASAIPQVALCLVVSCIFCPILTKLVVNKWGCAKN